MSNSIFVTEKYQFSLTLLTLLSQLCLNTACLHHMICCHCQVSVSTLPIYTDACVAWLIQNTWRCYYCCCFTLVSFSTYIVFLPKNCAIQSNFNNLLVLCFEVLIIYTFSRQVSLVLKWNKLDTYLKWSVNSLNIINSLVYACFSIKKQRYS